MSDDKLFDGFQVAEKALGADECSNIDAFITARTSLADFLDAALEQGCPVLYVAVLRGVVSSAYTNPPKNCAAAIKDKGDNRQLQYDAIAAIDQDLGKGVFIDGATVVTKHSLSHNGNHSVELTTETCVKPGADAAFAERCVGGNETLSASAWTFDAALIDPQRIDAMEKSALTVQLSDSAQTPEEYVMALTRRGTTSDATRVVLHCLPDTQCVVSVDGKLKANMVGLYCDPEVNCNDVLSHIVDVLAMMKRSPH